MQYIHRQIEDVVCKAAQSGADYRCEADGKINAFARVVPGAEATFL